MTSKKIKIKRDKYFRARDSCTRILKIRCAKCNKILFLYQKDGRPGGWLKRCYLNRIISQKEINPSANLKCCKVIGIPYKYKDGRIALKLVRGNFKRSYGDPVLK
ncbi:Uncharacterised protein [uncultured archaeon]|nr:Uncharacterised protein [uncultured archaeon]